MKKQLSLKAVLDSDLERVLDELGLLDQMRAGQLRCVVCDKKISMENFYCLYVEHGEIKFCCNSVSCYEKVASARLRETDA